MCPIVDEARNLQDCAHPHRAPCQFIINILVCGMRPIVVCHACAVQLGLLQYSLLHVVMHSESGEQTFRTLWMSDLEVCVLLTFVSNLMEVHSLI